MRAWGFNYREHPTLYKAPPKHTLLRQKPIGLTWTLGHTQIPYPVIHGNLSSQITPFMEAKETILSCSGSVPALPSPLLPGTNLWQSAGQPPGSGAPEFRLSLESACHLAVL